MEIESKLYHNLVNTEPVEASQKSSKLQVSINLLKSALGIGILALPYCFNQAGLVLSILFMILIAALTIFTVFRTIELADVKGLTDTNFKELYLDYVGKVGFIYFEVCMAINYFGVAVTYVIFFIDFFKNAFNTTGFLYTLLYSVISLIIIIPMTLIRKLELFTQYSFLGILLTLISLIVVIQYPLAHIDLNNTKTLADITEVPGLLGVAIFAFISPGLIIPMRNSMKNKHEFKSTFSLVIFIVLVIYVLFSIFCCLGFQQMQITEDILKGFGHINEYYLIVQGLYALALVLTYPMQLSPLIDVLENIPKIQEFLQSHDSNWFHKNCIRILISFLIFPCGIFISRFADFINLLGAFCFFVIQFIYPLWAYNRCFGERLDIKIRLFHYFLITVSFIGILLSSFSSISALLGYPQ